MKVTKTKSGKYYARVEIAPGPDGKRRWKSITANTKTDVRYIAAQYTANEIDVSPLLTDAVEQYISAKSAVLSPYTVKGYKNILKQLKAAKIGKIRADMTRRDAQLIVNAFRGMSQKTIKNRMGLISAAVAFAGYQMPPVTYPQKIKKEFHVPTEKEIQTIVNASKGTELEIPIALGLMGLRRGEICALTALDIKNGKAHVHAAAVDLGGEVTVKEPKTYDSDRWVQLPDYVAKMIRRQGYVTKLTPQGLSRKFARFLDKQNVQHFRFHDLRHFFASYCHNVLGLSDAQIQKLGGWRTDHVMKQIYIGSMRDRSAAEEAAAGIGGFYG